MRSSTIALGLVFASAIPVCGEPAEDPVVPRGLRPEFNEIKRTVYRRTCLAVAQVVRRTETGEVAGSGFFVGDSGQVVTVLPSIEEVETVWVNYGAEGKRRFEAEVLVSDPYTGLALLSVGGVGEVGSLEVGESIAVKPGDYLYGVSESADPELACSVGRLAGREKRLDGKTLAASVMRLHMDPPPEGFGAPLLDRDANLVGVILLGEEGGKKTGVSYALPVEHVAKLLRDHHRHGKASSAWLGLGMMMGTSTPEISSLKKGGPAEQAGLKSGDVILTIGDRQVADYQDVIDACYVLTVGEPVRFQVLRGVDTVTSGVIPIAGKERPIAGR